VRHSDVKRDADGNPVLPFVAKGATVLSLGTIVWDKPAFHQRGYLYPVGFRRYGPWSGGGGGRGV
jgi:hypothetical protein